MSFLLKTSIISDISYCPSHFETFPLKVVVSDRLSSAYKFFFNFDNLNRIEQEWQRNVPRVRCPSFSREIVAKSTQRKLVDSSLSWPTNCYHIREVKMCLRTRATKRPTSAGRIMYLVHICDCILTPYNPSYYRILASKSLCYLQIIYLVSLTFVFCFHLE